MSDLCPSEFLRNLAERLRHVPGTYDIDDGDIDELILVARGIEERFSTEHPTTTELATLYPKLEDHAPTEVERWRKTLIRLAPRLMYDGNILGCTLQSVLAMGHFDFASARSLLEAETMLEALGYGVC